MKCGRCSVEIIRSNGYIETIAHGSGQYPGQARVGYCTWFCAAVAFDLCALKTLETAPAVTQLPQCRSWLAEHGEDIASQEPIPFKRVR